MNNSFLLVAMVVIIGFFFFWTWRNNRKRQRDEAEKTSKLVAGAEVMTNFGLFGTVHSIDLENNKVVLEVSPGSLITVHRQTIARIEKPTDSEPDAAPAAPQSSSAIEEANAAAKAEAAKAAAEPEFGERIAPAPNTQKHDE